VSDQQEAAVVTDPHPDLPKWEWWHDRLGDDSIMRGIMDMLGQLPTEEHRDKDQEERNTKLRKGLREQFDKVSEELIEGFGE